MTGKPFSIEAHEKGPYAELEQEAERTIRLHLKGRPRAKKMWELLTGETRVTKAMPLRELSVVQAGLKFSSPSPRHHSLPAVA